MKTLYQKCKTRLLIIGTLIGIVSGCKKTEQLATPPLPAITVTASVAGTISDLNNTPVSGALVAAGDSTTTTDANGQFTLKDIELYKDAGFVKVTKAGYFTGSRTFLVNGNTTNNIKIQLLPKTVSGTIASSSGGNVDITGGAKINFTASSFVNADNNTAYSGDVAVAGYYLNPADANFSEYMPGDLRGLSTTNKEGILKSFGMLSVEMNDAGGQKLQLAEGKAATITIPIPSAMQAAAPATISLWYFDETKGIWNEEGTATRQSTNYVGTVAHFSFWTAGQLATDVRIDAMFKSDSSDIPLTNKLVTITSANYGTTNAYTDNTGKVSGLVPANETLAMKIFNDCGEKIYEPSVGPFNTDTDLGVIKITGNDVFMYPSTSTITGTVVNCANDAVSKGSVQVTIGSDTYKSIVSNGNFSLTFARCVNSASALASLIVYDSVKNQSGDPQAIDILFGNTQNIGQIKVCAAPTLPVAAFTYFVGNTALPVTVTFNNTSTDATSWLWNFGDGTSSQDQNPTHIYTTSGDFTVSLMATGPAGSNTISEVITISGIVDDSYINLTMNGTNYSWAPPDFLSANYSDSADHHTLIQAAGANWIYFFIHNDNTSPGIYNITLSATLNGVSYPNDSAATNVTEYGIPGGYIIGTASGQMKAQDSTNYRPFSMSYKVKRNQ